MSIALQQVGRFSDTEPVEVVRGCVAPMPAKVVHVVVHEGDHVTASSPVVVLEAMKMELTVTAQVDGRVAAVLVKEGDQVRADMVLARVDENHEGEP